MQEFFLTPTNKTNAPSIEFTDIHFGRNSSH